MDDLRQRITELALSDASKHGSANSKSVLGKLLGSTPSLRDKIQEVKDLVDEVVFEINSLSIDEINKRAPKTVFVKKKKEKHLPELSTNGTPVFRFAPSPSGPLHLGHTRAIFLNAAYRDRYDGKLILRIEDTNPSAIDSEAYELIKEDLKWLLDDQYPKDEDIYCQSNRMDIYYKDIRTLLEAGHAYVTHTPAEEWREKKRRKESDNYRDLSSAKQLTAFDKLLIEGSGIVVIKTDLKDPNPALRDFVAFRVNEDKHPLQGNEYRLWPTYNFAVSIDDKRMGITHVLRGKDHLNNTEKQKWIYKYMGWKKPRFIHYGLVSNKEVILKTTKIREEILDGTYDGWSDYRLGTVSALRRRGYRPEAFRNFWIGNGINEVDIKFSWENLNSENRKLIDSESIRLFFVPNPISFSFESPSEVQKTAPLHPDKPKLGVREETISSKSKIYLPEKDVSSLKTGDIIRLKNLCNVTFHNDKLVYHGANIIKGIPIFQWVSDKNIDLSLYYQDGSKVDGLVEDEAFSYIQETVQFERLGFVTLNGPKSNLTAFYLHK